MGIHDIAAARSHRSAARPLANAPLRQRLAFKNLKIGQPQNHAKKKEKESAHQQDQPLSYGGSR